MSKKYYLKWKKALGIQKLIKENNKASIIPGILNPITFTVYGKDPIKNEILQDELNKNNFSIKKGAMIGRNRFGFIIINKITNKKTLYPTQCRVNGICIENDIIKVFEEGKFHPWEFDLNGKMLKSATFEYHSRKDQEYIPENFDINLEKAFEETNSYSYKLS